MSIEATTGDGDRERVLPLLATRIDLLDAFDDSRIEVEVVPQIADLDADIVMIASGVGISPQCTNRRDMGAMNLDLFHEIAEQCAATNLDHAGGLVEVNIRESGEIEQQSAITGR